MEGGESYQDYGQQFFSDMNTRLRDLEEKQRILKDRILLIGESLIREREKNFVEIQDMKKVIIKVQEENLRLKEFVQRITEHLSNAARKEDLMILQRQFDLFRNT
ncbi:hypothetical protein J4408_04075 [Candidatus Pacearchaeota archaeon]|nr:hypothetical protein [Candidatus Pacearchaeota archaeon]